MNKSKKTKIKSTGKTSRAKFKKMPAAKKKFYTSTEFSKGLISSMQEGFQVLDNKGMAIDANPSLCRITGFSHAELINIGAPFPYWPPEQYESIQAAFEKSLKGNTSHNFELIFMRKNGERFPVIVSPSAIKNNTGRVIGYAATIKDNTEQKK